MPAIKVNTVSKLDLLTALEAERRDILDLYKSLSPADWNVMTLCTLWSVRDMLAHLITNDNPLWAMVACGFNADKANQKLIAQLKDRSNEQLVEEWTRHVVPRGMVASAPVAYLADDWVHNQDIRWPLGRNRQQDPSRMRLVLDALVKYNKKRSSGLHLVSTDISWENGDPDQPEVRGNAEEVAMGIANRPAAKAKLSGSGVNQLFA